MGSLPNLDQTPLQTSRISTVVPATPRGEEKLENSAYNLNYMDLLMKLHYIRSIYIFNSESVQNLSISDLKTPMFPLLDLYSHVSGRVRISESGRAFIKCNDAGVRIVESQCDKTVGEWLDENEYCVDGLVHDHVLGPDLAFSPLVFVKFTYFKCGGLSVGLSWAHILGDAFSAFNYMIWKCIAQIKGDVGQKVVTICTTNFSNRVENEFPTNGLVLSKIETNLSPKEVDILELVKLIGEKKINENYALEKLVEESEGKDDFIVYGAKLTFVDLEEADFYGVKINGQKPILANCDFHGVGDQGVVLVLPGLEDNDGNNGRMITISLPQKELDQLKCKLAKEWGI
ncbi:protein ECERIFERUM [Trifolium repens]|nr:protein ECERIFERUM [Trifolium repens]